MLEPGNGFNAPTPQPNAVGDPAAPGYDAKAIARWDVVPFQTFDAEFNIGVVAFHINGIDRVEFSVDGGPWTPVYEMKLNPRTDVWEYTATLDANLHDDGLIEVRAIAWPVVGEPRVVDVLYMNTDSTGQVLANREVRWVSSSGSNVTGEGTQGNPFATIKQAAMSINEAQDGKADNGLIYLTAGHYAFSGGYNGAAWLSPRTESAWLTVSAAPGLAPEQVVIDQGGSNQRLNASRIHLRGIQLTTTLVSSSNLNHPAMIWWEGCVLTTHDRFAAEQFRNGFSVYQTDTVIRQTLSGPAGVRLSRNVLAEEIGSDPFQNVRCLINSEARDCGREGWQAAGLSVAPHPDIVQWYFASGHHENFIVYGLRAIEDIGETQGFLFGSDPESVSDIALVNVLCAGNSQWAATTNHLLIWHSTFTHQWRWRDDA
ncbi:MAG: hypothetical protein IID31_00460, partial [Planctomycetes bacterium]|nr:hypothetical protein [Planctomycetota bacterium]